LLSLLNNRSQPTQSCLLPDFLDSQPILTFIRENLGSRPLTGSDVDNWNSLFFRLRVAP
jgi:hypothetical protein